LRDFLRTFAYWNRFVEEFFQGLRGDGLRKLQFRRELDCHRVGCTFIDRVDVKDTIVLEPLQERGADALHELHQQWNRCSRFEQLETGNGESVRKRSCQRFQSALAV